MSLIADPWNDQDVQLEELEKKISSVKINSHRAHSQWNDSSVSTSRTMNGPIEAAPTVRIMKRDNVADDAAKKVLAEKPVDKTLEERERAYAEARRRILGEDAVASSPTQSKSQRSQNSEASSENTEGAPRSRGGRGNGRGYRGHRNNRSNKPKNDEGKDYNDGENSRKPSRGRGNRASGYRGQRNQRASNNESQT